MRRTIPLMAWVLLPACSERKVTPEQCRQLELTLVQRCFGGSLASGTYIGDDKCWPFTRVHRMHGVWVIGLHQSDFAPNARRVTAEAPSDVAWLQTDLLNRRDFIAPHGELRTRAYLIDFNGRQSLCGADYSNFGAFGSYGREVIVDSFYSIRAIPVPAGQ